MGNAGRLAAAVLGGIAWLVGAVLAQQPAEDGVPFPPKPPSEQRARALFLRDCARCHGIDGAGDVAAGGPRPPSFSEPLWREKRTPAEVVDAILESRGHARDSAWRDRLSVQDRWDLATLVWSFGRSTDDVRRGQRLFTLHCADCHGAAGDGLGAAVTGGPPVTSDFSMVEALAHHTDAELMDTLAGGLPEFSMPGFAETLDEAQRAILVAYLRALPLSEVYTGNHADRRATIRSPRWQPAAPDDASPEPSAGPWFWLAGAGAVTGAIATAAWWWRHRRAQ